MNAQDHEALVQVVAMAEAHIANHETDEEPLLEAKAYIQTTKDGVLRYLTMVSSVIAGDISIEVKDG